jgi:hypothetical protein
VKALWVFGFAGSYVRDGVMLLDDVGDEKNPVIARWIELLIVLLVVEVMREFDGLLKHWRSVSLQMGQSVGHCP